MRNSSPTLAACHVLALVALTSSFALANPTFVHEGATDPQSEGWDQTLANCPGCTVGGGTETTPSGTYDYWRVQDSSAFGVRNYSRELCVVSFAGDWTFEASIRVIDSPIFAGTSIGTAVAIVGDGMNYWSFYLDNGHAGPLGAGVPFSLAAAFEVDTRDDYHVYSIEFSQNGPGPQDDTADFFVDGVLFADDLGRGDMYSSDDEFLFFGGAGTASIMDAHYQYVRFEGNLAADEDGDGFDNEVDNCPLRANPMQRDTDGDGYGNFCDPDLNNDNIVNAADLGIFKSVFFTPDPDADFDGSGVVNSTDLGIMKSLFFAPPGPICAL